MNICLCEINREACDELASKIFMRTSGIDKEGPKFERMKEEAFRIRAVIEDRIDIRAAYAYYDNVNFDQKDASIEGVRFHCNAFEQIAPDTVLGVYLYALSVGDFGFPEEPIMNQLYADIWGSAFTDAVRILMKKEIEEKARLSDSFGPGFYGMDVSQMEKLPSLIDFEELDIELRNNRVLLPLKSCAGLYFSVNDDYKALNKACQECRGTHKSCQLCQMSGGIQENV